jgi:cobalt-zinc-cadmium efflux system outer membrane protein
LKIKFIFHHFIVIVGFIFLFNHVNAQTLLQDYISVALKNNPGLQSYRLQSEGMQKRIRPAQAWDDPVIYASIMNLPVNFSFRNDPMTMKQVGIQQNFSLSKKYLLRGKEAEKNFEFSRHDAESRQLFLIYSIKEQYYDLYSIGKSIEATEKSIILIKSFISIANTRYSTGSGTLQDVFKAEVELTELRKEIIKMQSEQKDKQAFFNTLLNRGKNDSVEIPAELKYIPIPLIMDSLQENANINNPALLGAQTMIGKDSITYLLAKAAKIPDFNAGAFYGQRQFIMPDGTKALDMVGIQFGMTLPIWTKRKQNPLIEVSNIEIKKSKYQLEAMQNEISLMIHHAVIEADKDDRLNKLYDKQLLPQASENLNAGITGYQENKIDFMTLIDNFILLYHYRVESAKIEADYMKAIAELEMLTGQNRIN